MTQSEITAIVNALDDQKRKGDRESKKNMTSAFFKMEKIRTAWMEVDSSFDGATPNDRIEKRIKELDALVNWETVRNAKREKQFKE